MSSSKPAKMITQFSRQPHWLAERPNPTYSPLFKWTMAHIPLAMRILRAYYYWGMETDFAGFNLANGGAIRKDLQKTQADYIKREAPEKYHEALIPKTTIGCKRKVMDTEYLACLHRKNVDLVWQDPIEEIVEDGVLTKSGRMVKADAIVLATGFSTQQVLFPMDIRGEGGLGLQEHVGLRLSSLDAYDTDLTLVGPRVLRISSSIFRNLHIPLPQFLRPHGPEYGNRPSECHLHLRMPDQLHDTYDRAVTCFDGVQAQVSVLHSFIPSPGFPAFHLWRRS